jgi:octaprenyl-diphosphate synthase
MRAQAELAATTERLSEAAGRGPEPEVTQARLGALKLLVGDIIADVEAALPSLAGDGPGLAGHAARHLVGAGGKRVRPLLVILAARAAAAADSGVHVVTAHETATPAHETGETRAALTRLAQAAELVHAATLLHDDVLDDGRTRRGLPAARVLWGNAASVLGGDFLLIRALELTAASNIEGTLGELLGAIGSMIDGEALQLQHRGKSDLDPAGYLSVVDGKTASLFAWCGRAGARLAGAGQLAEALGAYGLHLGRAFQIVDDVLDVEGDPCALGKSVLSDLREGKLTLPVLYALEHEPELRVRLAHCLAADLDEAAEVAEAIGRTGAAQRARATAQRETAAAIEALAPLPRSIWADALRHIAHELCARVS